jgi:hypothetical protein
MIQLLTDSHLDGILVLTHNPLFHIVRSLESELFIIIWKP